jgi:hypothetical protein
MLTVLTWLWHQPQSRTRYTAEHVNIWASMVRRNLTLPHRIACVTDMPAGIDPSVAIIAPPGEFEDIHNPRWTHGKPQCYRRLAMFRRDAGAIFGDRFVCMDLDCVIGRSLDPLLDRPEELVLFKGTAGSRPYNGSMMLITAGCRPHVHDDFDQAGALESGSLFCGSDQAWLAHSLGWGEATWGEDDGVVHFRSGYRAGRPPPRIVFFPGALKPWHIVAADKYARAHYRLDRPLVEAV